VTRFQNETVTTFFDQCSPEGWQMVPAKRFCKEIDQRSNTGDEELLGLSKATGVRRKSEMAQRASEAENYAGYKRVAIGDLISNKMQAWNGIFGISPYDGITSPDYAIYRLNDKVEHRFVEYVCRTDLYAKEFHAKSRGMGSGFLRLNQSEFLSTPFNLPFLAAQRHIADFLDLETARIDMLIEKKQRLVALLGERQKVLIEEQLNAVDGSQVHRLKFAIHRIEQGWSPQCEDAPVEGEKWGVLKLGAITTGVYLEYQHKALPATFEPVPSLRVQVGDVLVARASGSPRLVGTAAFVETAKLNLMLSDKHFRLVCNPKKVLPEYLATVVNSGKSRSQIEDRLSSSEGMARNIGQNVIYSLRCPFPPLEIQEAILSALRISRTNTDAIVSKTNASIGRLKEYRSALITAAVTRQIDVTTYAKEGTPDRRLDAIQEEMGA